MEEPPPLIRRLLGCIGGACLVAFADALAFGRGASATRVVDALHAAAFAVVVGALLGLSCGAALGLAARSRRLCDLRDRVAAALDRARPDRDFVVRVHAGAAALVIALLVFVAGQALLLRAAWRLQIDDVALVVAVLGSVIVLGVAALLGLGLARWLTGPIARFDRRRALPIPADPASRFACWITAPAWAIVFGLRFAVPALPEAVSLPLLLSLALVTATQLVLSLRGRFTPGRPAAVGALVVLGAPLTWGVVETRHSSEKLSSLQTTSLGALGLSWLGALTDFDGDGASQWVGRPDCAPFDPLRGPFAVDRPGNDIDENCDGVDAQKGAELSPRFSDSMPAAKIRRYNVLWVIIDGLRADRVGHAGYRLPTTPQLDLLAQSSLVFTQAYAQSSATLYSFSSMFTGLDPAALTYRVQFSRPQLDESHVTLAERFAAERYDTAIFLTAWTQRYYAGLQQGMKTAFTSAELDSKGRAASQQTSPLVTVQAIQYIERALHAQKPFFGVVYYHDTHMPYHAHAGQPSFGDTPEALYDGEIAYVDRHLGVLLEYLRYRSKLWDDTIVIVTSDHGEEFGEHGNRHHAHACYVESTHVPLLLRVPGVAAREIRTPVALIDIAPTLLELTGLAPAGMSLSGQSLLVPAFAPEKSTPNRPIFCAVSSQWRKDALFFQRGVRDGHFSLIEDLAAGRVELYDVTRDPREQQNIAADPRAAAPLAALRSWLARTHTGNMTASW